MEVRVRGRDVVSVVRPKLIKHTALGDRTIRGATLQVQASHERLLREVSGPRPLCRVVVAVGIPVSYVYLVLRKVIFFSTLNHDPESYLNLASRFILITYHPASPKMSDSVAKLEWFRNS